MVQRVFHLSVVAALMLLCTATILPSSLSRTAQIAEARKLAADAAEDLRQVMTAPDTAIPSTILDSARCVAVFPSVKKAAFIIGAQAGDGIASCRDPRSGRWGTPIFLELKGGSIGWQFGGEEVELIMLGMTEDAVKAFSKDNFKFGADASVAAGPYGRQVQASTTARNLKSAFLSYSRAKGAYVGVSINGATITRDKDENTAVYGAELSAADIIGGNRQVPADVAVFTQALSSYSTKFTPLDDRVADKAEGVADKAENVGEKVVDTSKKIAGEVADKAEDVGDAVADGAKATAKAVTGDNNNQNNNRDKNRDKNRNSNANARNSNDRGNQGSGNQSEARKLVADATRDFEQIMRARDGGIPQEILDGAECVAVFPNVVKAAFIIGARAGDGIASCRDTQSGQWGAPVFLELKGGSVGWQIGAEAIDLVLLGMTPEASKILMRDSFKLGGDASIAAGPVGRRVSASTTLPDPNTGFISYSRTKGAFAGISLEGASISRDQDENVAIYGPQVSTEGSVTGGQQSPAAVAPFTRVLSKYSKSYRPMNRKSGHSGNMDEGSTGAADQHKDHTTNQQNNKSKSNKGARKP